MLLAVLIGVSLGALGSGGSIVTLPILVYVAGVDPKSAVGMSICIVGGTSLLGCLIHWRKGNFSRQTALLFSITGIPGAYIGSLGTHLIPSKVLLMLFSGLMLVVAGRMLLAKPAPECPEDGECSYWRCLSSGFVVGLVTGFLGVGGGFLIVPALIWFAGLSPRRAIGTSLGIIAVNSVGGLIGQLRYAHWDWAMTGKFFLCSLAGMGFGIAIASRTPARTLTKAFAMAVLAVGIGMGWKVLR